MHSMSKISLLLFLGFFIYMIFKIAMWLFTPFVISFVLGIAFGYFLKSKGKPV